MGWCNGELGSDDDLKVCSSGAVYISGEIALVLALTVTLYMLTELMSNDRCAISRRSTFFPYSDHGKIASAETVLSLSAARLLPAPCIPLGSIHFAGS